MADLYWSLTEDATRRHLLDMLIQEMSPRDRECFAQACDKIVVPQKHHHNLQEVMSTIDGLTVGEPVKCHMRAVYAILAEAEAHVHGCSVEETHFHEVGEAKALSNALAICIAFEIVAPSRVVASPVQPGKGKIRCAHGVLDIPAPATAAILVQAIPTCEDRREGEWCTPTSAALIKHFVDAFVDKA